MKLMAESRVHINLNLKAAGWASLEIRAGEKSHTIEGVSYTTDAVGDILRMGLSIATGAWQARASFDGEPVEMRLIAEHIFDHQAGQKYVRLRILGFADIYAHQPDEAGFLEFEAECDVEDFTHAVYEAASQMWEELGTNFKWGLHPFPLKALRALEIALATKEPART